MNIMCCECRTKNNYEIKNVKKERTVKDKVYEYDTKIAVCKDCNEELYHPEILEYDHKYYDQYYRKVEKLISIEEIEKIIAKYGIEKRPLSIILGFGELTITRYIEGQMPSKKYSDILYEVLNDSSVLESKLEENKEKITQSLYDKYLGLIRKVRKYESPDTKIEVTAQYVIGMMEEITQLALQKLLYFIQCANIMINNKKMYDNHCEAWVHGPVFPIIYDNYKEFGYRPIEYNFTPKNVDEYLSSEEKELIRKILNIYGKYNGKILEKITHEESPWLLTRGCLDSSAPCSEKIEFDRIEDYVINIKKKYDISEIEQIEEYVNDMVSRISFI